MKLYDDERDRRHCRIVMAVASALLISVPFLDMLVF